MKWSFKNSVVLIGALCCFVSGIAQSSASLKNKKSRLQKQINETNSLIKKNKSEKKATYNNLLLLNRSIELRENKVQTIEREIALLDIGIDKKQDSVQTQEQNLNLLKEEYQKMAEQAYKNRNNNDRLLYVFSGEDVKQSYRRLKYFQEYSESRKNKISSIQNMQTQLRSDIVELEDKRKQWQSLAIEQNQERDMLYEDKAEKKRLYAELKRDEHDLKAKFRKQVQQRAKLDKQIEIALKREIEKEAKTGYKISAKEVKLGHNFESSKGKLPLPVSTGSITGKFGKQRHPSGIDINSNGIDITTKQGNTVRAMYKGKVTSIFVVSGSAKSVIVSHGSYRTIYSNLQEVHVKTGDEVDTKQILGKLIPESSSGKSIAHIEIWQISNGNMKALNPEYWIYR